MKLKNIFLKKSFQKTNKIIKLRKAFFGVFNNGEYIIKPKSTLDIISSVKIIKKENLINSEYLKNFLNKNEKLEIENKMENLLKNSLKNLNEENFFNLVEKIKNENLEINLMSISSLIFLGEEIFENSEKKMESIKSYLLTKNVEEKNKNFFLNNLNKEKIKISNSEIENYFEENFVSLYKNKSEKNFLEIEKKNFEFLTFLIQYPEILKNEFYLEDIIKKMIFNTDINLLLLLTKKINKEIKEDDNLILFIEKVIGASLKQLNQSNFKNVLNFSIQNEIFLRSKFHMKLVQFFEKNFEDFLSEDIPLLIFYLNCLNFKKENLLNLCSEKLNEKNLEKNEDIFFLKLAENNLINFEKKFSEKLNEKFSNLNLEEINNEVLLESVILFFNIKNEKENVDKILKELENRKIENKELLLKTLTRLVELKEKNFNENQIDFSPFLGVLKNELNFLKKVANENEILYLTDLVSELFLEEVL